jgi:hypothetical protein
VFGYMKTDGHLGRRYLKGRAGDAADAMLTAIGYNFLILAWPRALLRQPASLQIGFSTTDDPKLHKHLISKIF